MKNLFFVAAGAIVIMLSACGKGSNVTNQADTSNSSKVSKIIGTWKYTTDTVRYYNSGTLDSTKSYSYFDTDNIVFNLDGTGVETRGGVAYTFSFSAVGNVLDLEFAKQPTTIQSVKIQTDGVRTLVSTGYNIIATIKQVSTLNMVMVFETTKGTAVTDETAYFTK